MTNLVTKSYGGRRETAKSQLEVKGTPYGHRTDSERSPLKACGDPATSVRSPSAFLTQKVDESRIKKSYDACMYCNHRGHSPWSPTVSNRSLGKSQTKQSYGDLGKCNLGIHFVRISLHVSLISLSFLNVDK